MAITVVQKLCDLLMRQPGHFLFCNGEFTHFLQLVRCCLFSESSQLAKNAAELQRNFDGNGYELRRITARSKKGRIKRPMFAKLRPTKYLKTNANTDSASVQFDGKVQRIAPVHHYSLRDRVSRKGTEIRYAERRLLGVNDDVESVTLDALLRWLN